MAVRAKVLHVISVTDCCHRVTTKLQVTNNNNVYTQITPHTGHVGSESDMTVTTGHFLLSVSRKLKKMFASLPNCLCSFYRDLTFRKLAYFDKSSAIHNCRASKAH